eukprot:TRINITY_DN5677_c0_g2_i1.p1 TRINITY_DN5677_c0_g2~~TRINITY_DN5677_c0_g2_i1.p1  ORF type:complete len:383 (+),score=140.18 TRINITY_DN5677_c0_g2_i1:93-1241(+)
MAANKLLSNQLRTILADPVEGFMVELKDDNLFEWNVYIEGPKDTPYEGGIYRMLLEFPKDYPMTPPVLKFVSDFWHPNVYTDGKVCMSILHAPGEDAMSGEAAGERWMPTQSVSSVILSLISMLNDPNFSSPANVDASVEWRKNKEAFVKKCKKLVEKANAEVPAHVVIPHPDTNEDEHKKTVAKWKEMNTDLDYEDFYDIPPESDDNDNDNEEEEEEEQNSSSSSSEDEEEKTKDGDDTPSNTIHKNDELDNKLNKKDEGTQPASEKEKPSSSATIPSSESSSKNTTATVTTTIPTENHKQQAAEHPPSSSIEMKEIHNTTTTSNSSSSASASSVSHNTNSNNTPMPPPSSSSAAANNSANNNGGDPDAPKKSKGCTCIVM